MSQSRKKPELLNQLLPIVDKYYSRSMEDIVQGIFKDELLAITLFVNRMWEMARPSQNGNKLNPQDHARKAEDTETFFRWYTLLKEKLTEPASLTNQELLMLGIVWDKQHRSSAQFLDETPLLLQELAKRTKEGEENNIDPRLLVCLGSYYENKAEHRSNWYGRTDPEVRADNAEAAKYYQRAVSYALPVAMDRLARFIKAPGYTYPKDYTLIWQAAEKGDPDALMSMGNAYLSDEDNKNGLNLKEMNLADRLAKAEECFVEALKKGNCLSALYSLAGVYEKRDDIANAAKCMAVREQYGAWGTLHSLLQNHPYSPHVIYYAYYHTNVWKGGRTGIPSEEHQLEIKNKFMQVAASNLENKKDEYTEFDKLLMEQPWGEYRFEVRSSKPEDGEIETDKIYVYPAENNTDYNLLLLCFSPDTEITDQLLNRIQVLQQAEGIPILIKQGGRNSLYGNSDGTTWKRMALDDSIFAAIPLNDRPSLVTKRSMTPEMYNDITTKQAHTSSIEYAVKNQANKIVRGAVHGESILGPENFSAFTVTIKTLSTEKLTPQNKENFLDSIARQGSIPRERILPLLDMPLAEKIHQRKLYQLARAEFDLERRTGDVAESGVTAEITSFAANNVSSAERNKIDEMKEKLQAIVVKKRYAMFSQQVGETKEQGQPRTPTLRN